MLPKLMIEKIREYTVRQASRSDGSVVVVESCKSSLESVSMSALANDFVIAAGPADDQGN